MAIRSPYNSFVDFNSQIFDCSGNTRQARLPVVGSYSIKFQIKIENEILPLSTNLYAGVATVEGEVVTSPDVEVIQTCSLYSLRGTGDRELTDDLFPIQITDYTPVDDQPQVPAGTYDRAGLLQVLSDTYGITLDSYEFYDCCSLPEISGIPVIYSPDGLTAQLSLNQYWGYGYVDYPADPIEAFSEGECFKYAILDADNNVLALSNLFYVSNDLCYTTVITYYNEENGYGFRYVVYDDNGIERITQNQVRLPFYLRRPQFQITENIFRRSDGVKERTSTVIEKDWLGTVGYLSAEQHEKLVVALKHDYVNINNGFSGVNYRMTQEGEYTPGYPDDINSALVPAEFRISDYSHNYVNNNCGFNCGIEFVNDCESQGGGTTNPCPEKFTDEFTVGGPQLADGGTLYQNDNLKGSSGVEVYREGLFQHPTGLNNAVFNSSTGQIVFTPAGYAGERIAIVEI